MKKINKIAGMIFVLFMTIVFLSGCSGNNGSYLAPISVLPYTSGEYGSLKGVIRTTIKPYKYFNLIKEGDPTDTDTIIYLSSGQLMYDDLTFVIVDDDTFEVMTNSSDDILDFTIDEEIDTRIKANIRIGGKTYSYNPEFEKEYTVDDIPVGFHSLSIEVDGFEVYRENIMVESGEKIKDFNIEPVEYKAPNYFRKISNVYCTITTLEKQEESDEDEAANTEEETEEEENERFLKIVWNKLTRFSKKEISVFIDDTNLISNGLTEYKDDFIEMLALWENAGAGITFEFATEREEADITVEWEDTSVMYNWSRTDEENPYRAFKPVITLALYNPNNGTKLNTTYRRAVMAREIGRSLGLTGNSGNNNDIMYYGEDINIEGDVTLSASDKNTLIMLYNTVPAISEKTYDLN